MPCNVTQQKQPNLKLKAWSNNF